jgi:hypothetical protein
MSQIDELGRDFGARPTGDSWEDGSTKAMHEKRRSIVFRSCHVGVRLVLHLNIHLMSRLLRRNVYLGGIGKNMGSTTHVLIFTQLSCSFMLTWAVTSKKGR